MVSTFRSVSSPHLAVRVLGLLYAALAFIGTWAFFAYLILFLGNLPRRSEPWLFPSVDVGHSAEPLAALAWNAGLILVFCLQHSLMARSSFKQRLAALIPPALERATYVHAANLAGFGFLLFWMPVDAPLWSVESDALKTILWIAFAAGWALLFAAAFSMNVFELLGLHQALAWFRGDDAPPLKLKTGWLYGWLEHPMYVGVLLGFWATPYMTVGHAALAAQLTVYIAIAMFYERRDLEARYGTSYARWRHAVVGGTAPWPTRDRREVFQSAVFAVGAELKRRHVFVSEEPLPFEIRRLLSRL